jgi:hypothetical protein
MTHADTGEPGLEPQRDVRLFESGAYEHMAPIDVQTERMRQRIEAVHRRLLERATDGRLTWAGEQIVHQTPLPSGARIHDSVVEPSRAPA